MVQSVLNVKKNVIKEESYLSNKRKAYEMFKITHVDINLYLHGFAFMVLI